MVTEHEPAEELRAAIAKHKPGDFSLDAFWWKICDFCEADSLSRLNQANYLCRKCGLTLCSQHFQIVIDRER